MSEKKKHTVTDEISWCNVLWRAGTDLCVNDNFPGTFVDFCIKIFIQERISICDDPWP